MEREDPDAPYDWEDQSGNTSKLKAGLFYEVRLLPQADPHGPLPLPLTPALPPQTYHSHKLQHLQRVRAKLAAAGCERFVYLAGDSSLDNKHWFFEGFEEKKDQMHKEAFTADAVNGYEQALTPARMVQDVSYWLNKSAEERLGSAQLCTLMTSVEESTIADRESGLLGQDSFIRDKIAADDTLIISLGGNDVALRPTTRTIVNMAMLTRSPDWLIRKHIAPGFGYFVKVFGDRVEELVGRIVAKQKPAKILVCMIYHLDEVSGGRCERTAAAAAPTAPVADPLLPPAGRTRRCGCSATTRIPRRCSS